MKNTRACPKCSGRKLFYIPEVHQPPEDNGWEYPTRPRAVTAVVKTVASSTSHGRYDILEAAPCEAVVCGACGFIEWYASPAALAVLEAMARDSNAVRVVQDPPQAPYR